MAVNMKKNNSGPYSGFIVSGEMIPERGEDASCLMIAPESASKRVIFGVFDGCGGLGARRYPSEDNKTGAYIAARLAASVLSEAASGENMRGDAFEKALGEAFLAEKQRLEEENGSPPVRSDMVRSLPTTVCAALIEDGCCDVAWLGDSRLYSLDAKGLHKLTADDGVPGGDEPLYCDRRLTGYVNADTPFGLFKRKTPASQPRVWIAATDGIYSAFRTPMELEATLLRTLRESLTTADWKKRLSAEIDETASDDFTAVLLFGGYPSFATMKKKLAPREKYIAEKLKPLYEAGEDDERFNEAAAALWSEYKKDYLKY